MQTARDLVLTLRSKGWQLWTADGRLYYRAPNTGATAEEISRLRSLKPQVLETLLQFDSSAEPALVRRIPHASEPLTYLQQSFWEDGLTWGRTRAAHIRDIRMCATASRILGALDAATLRASLSALVRRHETLRTRFVSVNGACVQEVYAAHECDLEVVDISSSNPGEVERTAQRLVDEVVYEPTGPLFKARILKLADREHVLVLAMNHMISDAASVTVLGRELAVFYDQIDSGSSPSLPALPIQYADYAVWQQQYGPQWDSTHSTYWKGRLADAPRVNFNIENELAQGEKLRLARVEFVLGEPVSERLRETARRCRTTLAMAVLTVYVVALCSWQRKRDWVVRYLIEGRDRPELQGLIGFVASCLYLRIQVEESDTYATLLPRVTNEYRNAYLHNDFGRLHVSGSWPAWKRGPFINWIPRTDSNVATQQRKPRTPFVFEPFSISPGEGKVEYEAQAVGVRDPEVVFLDSSTGVTGVLSYPLQLFRAETIERLAWNVRRLAERFGERPDALIRAVPYE